MWEEIRSGEFPGFDRREVMRTESRIVLGSGRAGAFLSINVTDLCTGWWRSLLSAAERWQWFGNECGSGSCSALALLPS